MLEYSLEVESLQVKLYTEALELCGEKDVALRVVLEDICTEEQEGVDHLEKLLKKRELAISGHAQDQPPESWLNRRRRSFTPATPASGLPSPRNSLRPQRARAQPRN